MVITAEQATDIRRREDELKAWMGTRKGYYSDELPPSIKPPSNAERSSLEVYEFCRDKPERYFLYINVDQRTATTWTGEKLGFVSFGKSWRDNFGGTRVHIRINAVNGCHYYGTYFKTAGDYARVKKVKA